VIYDVVTLEEAMEQAAPVIRVSRVRVLEAIDAARS
jgi:hypothetical protein